MTKKAVQYYDDDIYGFVKYVDIHEQHHGSTARPSHIKILSDVPAGEKKTLRRAIANDINGGNK